MRSLKISAVLEVTTSFTLSFTYKEFAIWRRFRWNPVLKATTYTKNFRKLLLKKSSSVNENVIVPLISTQWQSEKDEQ